METLHGLASSAKAKLRKSPILSKALRLSAEKDAEEVKRGRRRRLVRRTNNRGDVKVKRVSLRSLDDEDIEPEDMISWEAFGVKRQVPASKVLGSTYRGLYERRIWEPAAFASSDGKVKELGLNFDHDLLASVNGKGKGVNASSTRLSRPVKRPQHSPKKQQIVSADEESAEGPEQALSSTIKPAKPQASAEKPITDGTVRNLSEKLNLLPPLNIERAELPVRPHSALLPGHPCMTSALNGSTRREFGGTSKPVPSLVNRPSRASSLGNDRQLMRLSKLSSSEPLPLPRRMRSDLSRGMSPFPAYDWNVMTESGEQARGEELAANWRSWSVHEMIENGGCFSDSFPPSFGSDLIESTDAASHENVDALTEALQRKASLSSQRVPEAVPSSSSQGLFRAIPSSSSPGRFRPVPSSSFQRRPGTTPSSTSQGLFRAIPSSSSPGRFRPVPSSSFQRRPGTTPSSTSQGLFRAIPSSSSPGRFRPIPSSSFQRRPGTTPSSSSPGRFRPVPSSSLQRRHGTTPSSTPQGPLEAGPSSPSQGPSETGPLLKKFVSLSVKTTQPMGSSERLDPDKSNGPPASWTEPQACYFCRVPFRRHFGGPGECQVWISCGHSFGHICLEQYLRCEDRNRCPVCLTSLCHACSHKMIPTLVRPTRPYRAADAQLPFNYEYCMTHSAVGIRREIIRAELRIAYLTRAIQDPRIARSSMVRFRRRYRQVLVNSVQRMETRLYKGYRDFRLARLLESYIVS
ncbi:hypothetical protein XA68_18207 [Ophiocordyceps unilateralis]|uniref:RING-type domain-containing protein n=1 Tax=Ophiocordyceps unilateralis TaxID=268505 RepID=A0A2A9PRC3_OPHUN|nr:hypothetical protein XA68_18207 [Ophiocordyceps unilateralis]